MRLLISAFFSIVIFLPFYFIMDSISSSKKRQEAAFRKTIARGQSVTAVTAVLKKRRAPQRDVPGAMSGQVCLCKYEYMFQGKTYRYRRWSEDSPATLRLYFVRDPRRVAESQAKAVAGFKICWPVLYLLIVCLIYLFLSWLTR